MTPSFLPHPESRPASPDLRFRAPRKERVLAALERGKAGRARDVFAAGCSPEEQAIAAHLLVLGRGSQGTTRVYLSALLEFFACVEKSVERVTALNVEEWILQLERRGKSPATVANRLAAVKSFFSFLWKMGFLPHNPAAPVRAPRRVEGHYADRVLLRAEIETLLAYTQTHACARDHALCRLLFSLGLRGAEAAGLRWEDFFPDARGRWFATVRGKGKRTRHVYVPADLMRALLDWKAAAPPPDRDGPVFSARRTPARPMCTASIFRIVRKWGRLALRKDISPHWFRHSFATHARLAGASLEQIRVQLGHVSYQTTVRYEHSPHILDAAGQALEKNLSLAPRPGTEPGRRTGPESGPDRPGAPDA